MKQELNSQLTKKMLNHQEGNKDLQKKEKVLTIKSTKKTSKHLEGKDKTKTLDKSKTDHLFFIEKLGYFFILFSGLVPFLHSFVKFEKCVFEIYL
jgi:hypothetical protein